MTTQPPPTFRASTAHAASGVVMPALRGILAATVLVALLGGVPWALVRYIGWPLPNRVPTWAELQAILTTPIGTSLLVDVLAVLCWLAWAAFVVDIIRAVPAAVHAARRGVLESAPAGWSSPLHGLAAVLVTAVAVAVLAHRPSPESPATFAAVTTQAVVDGVQLVASTPAAAPEEAVRSVEVREPRDGVHDCLWRIADRELGDGARWPEIYQLNQGRTQADGRALTDPNLIYPGWILILPDTTTPESPAERAENDESDAPEKPPEPPTPTPTTSSPRPTVIPSSPAPPNRGETSTDTTPADTDTTAPTAPAVSTDRGRPSWPPGIDLGPGAYIGMGLAAAISAALLVARRRRRRWYPPGSGYRADLPVTPVVRTLQVARLSYAGARPGRPSEPEPTRDGAPLPTSPGGRSPSWPRDLARPAEGITDAGLPVGVYDDHRVVMDLARNRGLGLVGPGAADVARALLVTQLTTHRDSTTTQIVIPTDDAEYLLEQPGQQGGWPTNLSVVANLDTALDHVEAYIRHAATDVVATASIDPPVPLVVLIATPRPETSRRLQVALDNGSTTGVAGILLDQWRPGATIHVRGDGTVNATNPGPAQHLRGARLFTLPTLQATDLLALLHDTETPASPSSVTGDQDDDPASPRTSPATVHSPDNYSHQESTDYPVSAPLLWSILGPPRLTWRHHTATHDVTTALTPRQRDLLVYVALHPDGAPRHTLAETLWPHGPTERPANALHTTLSRLRRTLRAATSDDALAGLVTARGDRYQLDPDLVDVDYWHLARAVNRSRAAVTNTDRVAADQDIITRYVGELAADMTANWLDVPREAARRDAIDAAARLARARVDNDPQQALHLLEQARGFDPYNELIYRDIMRIQARLGHRDAISRTLTLLAGRLAELDEHPDPATVALARDLRRPRPDHNRAQYESHPNTRAAATENADHMTTSGTPPSDDNAGR